MTENYRGCYEYLSAQYPEVGGYEFYKELFPDNENSGERHTDFSHPNAVYLYRDEQSEDKKLRRRKMYNDTWEQDYMEFVEGNSLTLCSGLAYRRKENRLENAQRMYALIFDLDGRRSCRAAQPLSALWRRSGASAPVADADFPCSVGDRAAYLLCFPAAD